jgi:uncharacterized protein YfaS (alpha-2-macroglobulin family)
VLQASGGLAASSVIFYSGWAVGDNPDVPARVSVRADRKTYQPGDTATIHVEAPYAGPATVLVMTDRVKRLIDLTPTTPAFDVTVPVGADPALISACMCSVRAGRMARQPPNAPSG